MFFEKKSDTDKIPEHAAKEDLKKLNLSIKIPPLRED